MLTQYPKLALAVTMFDEAESVTHTVTTLGPRFLRIEVMQSQEEPYPALAEALGRHAAGAYSLLPNLDPRTPEERAAKVERFDFVNRSIARNLSQAFANLLPFAAELEYVVAITGDTLLLYPYGLWDIIGRMGTADVAVSRAMGQDFHRADLTREQIANKNDPKGGRKQDETVKDFMPQLFIARASLIERLSHIAVTNPWCSEQCMGDAVGDANLFVFSETAYGYSDGVIYHVPSPTNWRH